MKRNFRDYSLYRLLFKNDLFIVAILFLVAFILRFSFLALSDNFTGGQSMLNIITSLHVISEPSLLENIHYQQLPLYLYSLAFSVILGAEQLISARFLSLFFGSLCLIPFYWFIKKAISRKIALFSAVMFCFYPLHIIKSVVSLPDVIGLFFVLCSLYFITCRKIIVSAIFCGVGCGYAYMAWLFIPVLTLFILIQEEIKAFSRVKLAVVFFLITIILPVCWISFVAMKNGQFGLFHKNSFFISSFYTFLYVTTSTVKSLLEKLFEQPMPLLFLLSSVGIFYSFRIKKYYNLIYFIGAIIILGSLGIFRQEIAIINEIFLVLSVLLIPFISLGILFCLRTFRINNRGFIWYATVLLSVMLLCNTVTRRPYLPMSVKQVSSWIRNNVKNDERVFLDKDGNGYYTAIMMLSGIPQGNFYFLKEKQQYDKTAGSSGGCVVIALEDHNWMYDLPWQKVKTIDAYKIFKINSKL